MRPRTRAILLGLLLTAGLALLPLAGRILLSRAEQDVRYSFSLQDRDGESYGTLYRWKLVDRQRLLTAFEDHIVMFDLQGNVLWEYGPLSKGRGLEGKQFLMVNQPYERLKSRRLNRDGSSCFSTDQGSVFALDDQGNERWSHSFHDPALRYSPRLELSSQGIAYFTTSDASVKALSPEGEVLWCTAVDGCAGRLCSLAPDEQRIYCVTDDRSVVALSREGQLLWRSAAGLSGSAQLQFNSSSQPLVFDTNATQLLTLGADGQTVLSLPLKASWALVEVLAEDRLLTLYSGPVSEELRCLSADGTELWKRPFNRWNGTWSRSKDGGLILLQVSEGADRLRHLLPGDPATLSARLTRIAADGREQGSSQVRLARVGENPLELEDGGILVHDGEGLVRCIDLRATGNQ